MGDGNMSNELRDKIKIYTADEIWAGREYSPVEVPMGAEFVSKQDYDELEGRLTKAELENKRITDLESDLAYVRKTADMQLETISDMDKNLAKAESERDESTDEIILLGNDIVNLRSELSELKRGIDESPFVWIARDKCGDVTVFEHKPIRADYRATKDVWIASEENFIELVMSDDTYPTLKWEDEPIQVALVKMGDESK